MNITKLGLLIFFAMGFFSCDNDDGVVSMNDMNPATIDAGNDPNFSIVANSDEDFAHFNRKVMVFEIPIYATSNVEDNKLLHAANIMAQYLDNDEDEVIDNMVIYNSMRSNKAFLMMWKTEADRDNFSPPNGFEVGQDLGADETVPVWHTNGHSGQFDAAIEEVWHIITNGGHERAYPSVFGTQQGSQISNAMDVARGGVFQNPPATYPESAWYSYDDPTCDYQCQGGEYIYWAMTSILGAQDNRFDEIGHEWKLNTKEKVENGDLAVYQLLTDPQYNFPKVLPDGSYRH